MSEPQFTEFTEAEWDSAEADYTDTGEELDWDRESSLREVVGEFADNPTGTYEQRDEEVLDGVIQGFRDRAGREAERHAEVTLADTYVVMCFATRDQRDAYLRAKGWMTLGRRYIDARAVAAREGIDLPPDPEWPQNRRDRSWDSFAMTVEENRALPDE